VTLLTSGTSGEPKGVEHTWESLLGPVRKMSCDRPHHWLLAYRASLYAGLQVVLQCYVGHGTLVVPERGSDPQSIAALLADAQVDMASATPSYWRQLLLRADRSALAAIPLEQITLGGEAVDQALLDRLRSTFPAARIVQIYATTELGRCFSVSDAREGFPAAYFERQSPEGVELKLEQGELLVRPAHAMRRYDPLLAGPTMAAESGWFRTGDLVRIEGDRAYFVGRKTDIINVGGNKVHPLEVEQVVRSVAGVAEARVYARRSSLAGELVACEVLPDEQALPFETLKSAIAARCAAALAEHQRPRWIERAGGPMLSGAGKLLRSAPE
jgi:acyl-CoA synthetase (AMP-forming)/AMP-acid ligase II